MAKFYADENVALRLVEFLEAYGHDIFTVYQAGRANLGLGDDVVVSDAAARERVALTNNRKDFRKLHRDGHNHVGIVEYTIDIDLEGLASRIHAAISDSRAVGRFYASVTKDGHTFR